MKKLLLLFSLVLTGILVNAQATLNRGPYLQSLTNKSIKIMWRTTTPTQAIVKIGSSPDALDRVIIDTAKTYDHIILVDGLSARTKYYYSVGYDESAMLAGADEQHHFYTAPNIGDTSGFKFWVIGDFGAGNNRQIKVRKWFENYIQTNHVEGWLWLGDNAYQDGKDVEYTAKVFSNTYGYDSIFRFLPFYPIPGNHDYNSVNQSKAAEKHSGPYYNMVEVFRNAEMGGTPSNTEAYYSFDYGNVHFMALNSELYNYALFWDLGHPYKDWIEKDIKNTDKKFKVALIHQAPYSKGSHDTDDFYQLFMMNTRKNVVPILEKYGIDLVLSGHSHVYERSRLMHSHYGTKSSSFDINTMVIDGSDGNPDSNRVYTKYTYGPLKDKGTVYTVVGNSGKNEPYNGKMHPVFIKKYDKDESGADNGSGSMILEVKGNELTCSYYTLEGVLFDKFRIVKQDTTIVSGIKQNTNIKEFKIYPNPFSDKLIMEIILEKTAPTEIYIQNTNGQLVVDKISKPKTTKGKNIIEIDDLGHLPVGNYVVSIMQDGIFTSQQIIKQ